MVPLDSKPFVRVVIDVLESRDEHCVLCCRCRLSDEHCGCDGNCGVRFDDSAWEISRIGLWMTLCQYVSITWEL